jgi:hypothetical protein
VITLLPPLTGSTPLINSERAAHGLPPLDLCGKPEKCPEMQYKISCSANREFIVEPSGRVVLRESFTFTKEPA